MIGKAAAVLSCAFVALVGAQSTSLADGDGYTGYKLVVRGDGDSAVYESENTDTQKSVDANFEPPDVFLNASVHVGDIGIDVQDLTAKINLDAQVLSLLQFSAGVDISVERVNLNIQNVTGKVLLEARLGNLVAMVSDVLESIDLNPLIVTAGNTVAQIGSGVGQALNGTTGGGGSGGGSGSSPGTPTVSNSTTGSNLTARAVHDEIDRVLFSKNDYSGNTHTNRVLANDGDIVDQYLDNDGRVKSQQVIGDYASEFSYTGEEREVTVDGQVLREREYEYNPYYGLRVVSVITFDAQDRVVAARVLSEFSAGGTSTISGD